MQTVTCIVRDNHHAYHDPLIYSVEVENPQSQGEVQSAVELARMADLGDLEEGDALDLDVLLVFAGNLNPVSDWRE